MSRWFHDQRVFWRQFREHFHTTGSVLPSGRFLGRALARFVGTSPTACRVLEVGPGTGAVTAEIVRRLGSQDRFDLVELNAQFVDRLRERFDAEERLSQGGRRAPACCTSRSKSLPADEPYDLIISGLPLNNFSVADVERILGVLMTPVAARRHAVVLRVHRHSTGPIPGQRPRRAGAAARHRRGTGRDSQAARDPPRLDLAQRAASLGPPRALPLDAAATGQFAARMSVWPRATPPQGRQMPAVDPFLPVSCDGNLYWNLSKLGGPFQLRRRTAGRPADRARSAGAARASMTSGCFSRLLRESRRPIDGPSSRVSPVLAGRVLLGSARCRLSTRTSPRSRPRTTTSCIRSSPTRSTRSNATTSRTSAAAS